MSAPSSVMMSQPREERDPHVRHASSQTPPPLDPTQVELNTTLSPTRSPRSPTTTNGESHMNGRASGQPALPAEMSDYIFPDLRLKQVMDDDSKTPLVLVACGSFSPITYLHLRMFVMVADYVKFHTDFEIVGGYLSPVSDAYQKKGLASAEHRLRMCELASESSPWLMVDPWEAIRKEYTRTALVLDHFADEINEKRSGVATISGSRKPARIALLAGADLIGTMSTPGVWSFSDLDHILGRYGAFIVERMGTDVAAALSFPAVNKWKENIFVIPQLIMNDVSSTKIRQFLGKEMKVDYLIDPKVIQYINHYGLYEDAEERKAQTHQRTKSGEVRAVVNGEESLKTPGQS